MAKGQWRDNTGDIDSEAQRWMTLHPASRQESADRRPLLQQSCPDLRIPGSQQPPDAPPQVPPGLREPIPGHHGPRCRLEQLRPEIQSFTKHRRVSVGDL